MTPLEVQQIIGRLLAPNATPDCNGELRTWITEGSIDWRQMVVIASEHLVAPALSLKLQQRGLLALLDLELRNYLSSLAGLNRQRNQQILNQMADLIHVLDGIGVTPLFLKGTAHVLLGLYSNLSQRVIGDIDLLVPKEHLVECVVALRDHGYVDTSRPKPLPPNHHHAHPLIHNLHPAAVELHTHLIAKRWRSALPTADVVDNATQHEVDGQTVLLPCPEDLIVHNIAHSQLSQQGFWSANLSLRDAYDLILLFDRFVGELDHGHLLGRLTQNVGRGCSVFYLQTAHMLFDQPCPLSFPETLSAKVTSWRWHQHAVGRLKLLYEIMCLLGPILARLPRWQVRRM